MYDNYQSIASIFLIVGLCGGCSMKPQIDRDAGVTTAFDIHFYHDNEHNVSCWMTSFAMSCLPDSSMGGK
jgi:hypothetical protein